MHVTCRWRGVLLVAVAPLRPRRMIAGVTGLRRLVALSFVTCAAPSNGRLPSPEPIDEARQPPARHATDALAAPSSAHEPVRDLGAVQSFAPPESTTRPSLPWQTGSPIGHGVAFKDTMNAAGENLFIGYAGYQVSLASAETWVDALYEASLAARGVRYLWAVQGPNDHTYSNFEIGNTKLVASMLPLVETRTRFILVAAHSSGSFVAHELFARLAGGMDPEGVTAGRVVYFNLDGGASGLTTRSVGRLRRAYFVGAHDGNTGTDSPRLATMRSLGATYASAGGFWQNDASDAGCHEGAQWCVHNALITTRPHAPTSANAKLDYSEFTGRGACHSWIDAKADEAGLH